MRPRACSGDPRRRPPTAPGLRPPAVRHRTRDPPKGHLTLRRPLRRQRDHRPRGSWPTLAMGLADRQNPGSVIARREPAVPVLLPDAGGRAEGHWSRRTVAEPHPLIRLIDVSERARGTARNQTDGTPAVLVDAAADAHRGRRVVATALRSRPDEDHPAPLRRARLQPVERVAVRAELREGDLSTRHVARGQRRRPMPVRFLRGHGPNVPGRPRRPRRDGQRIVAPGRTDFRPTCSRKQAR